MAGSSHDPTRPAEHGSASMYERHKCRCEACRESHRVKVAEYRRKRRLTGWRSP